MKYPKINKEKKIKFKLAPKGKFDISNPYRKLATEGKRNMFKCVK